MKKIVILVSALFLIGSLTYAQTPQTQKKEEKKPGGLRFPPGGKMYYQLKIKERLLISFQALLALPFLCGAFESMWLSRSWLFWILSCVFPLSVFQSSRASFLPSSASAESGHTSEIRSGTRH